MKRAAFPMIAGAGALLVLTAVALPRLRALMSAGAAPEVTWNRVIRLQETSDVINVWPLVRVDPRGGFLVVDSREAQVRRYLPNGLLAWHFGTRGPGPSEFRMPTVAVRLRTGEVLVADLLENVTVLDSSGLEVLRTFQVPLEHVQDLDVIDDSLVLFSGIGDLGKEGPRLHVYNLRTNTIVRSFFTPFRDTPHKATATMANWSMVEIKGDTAAVVFAVSDTVYLYGLNGVHLKSIPIQSHRLRRPTAPPAAAYRDVRKRAEWLGSFDLAAVAYWQSDGGFAIGYQTRVKAEPRWQLLKITRSGVVEAHIPATPTLLTSLADSLVFVHPKAEVPNTWAVGLITRQRWSH